MIAVDAVNEGDARPVLRELLRRPEDPANLQLPLLNDPSQVGLKQCEKKENKMNDFGKVVSYNNELNSFRLSKSSKCFAVSKCSSKTRHFWKLLFSIDLTVHLISEVDNP